MNELVGREPNNIIDLESNKWRYMYKKNLFAFVSNDTVTVNLCLLLNLLSGERTILAVKI